MKSYEKVLLVYGGSLLGSAIYHYAKGARGADLLSESAVSALLLGSGVNVVLWLHNQSVDSKSQEAFELPDVSTFSAPKTLLYRVKRPLATRPAA